eukprot:3691333-Amphidinium_carterae.1
MLKLKVMASTHDGTRGAIKMIGGYCHVLYTFVGKQMPNVLESAQPKAGSIPAGSGAAYWVDRFCT